MYVPQKKVKSNQRTRRLADVLPQPWYKQQAPGNPDESPALALLISRGEKKRKTGEDDEPMQMAVCMYGRMYGVMIGVINFRDLETQSRENFLSPFFLFLFFFSFLFSFFGRGIILDGIICKDGQRGVGMNKLIYQTNSPLLF